MSVRSNLVSLVTVIGPNPAEDQILDVPEFKAGGVFRSRRSLHAAAGKPLNVARTLSRLGMRTRLIVPLGSNADVKDRLETACRDLGIEMLAVEIAGHNRTCTVIIDTKTGSTTVVNEAGPDLSESEASAYTKLVMTTMISGGLAIACGSLPPGLPSDMYGQVAAAASRSGTQFILDSSGDGLFAALGFRPWAVKVNHEEISEVSGQADPVAAARWVLESGVEHVVVTTGAAGAIYVGVEGAFRVLAPKVTVVNTVGAGDAFSAGLVCGLAMHRQWKDGLRRGAASAALWVQRFEPDIGPEPNLDPLPSTIEVLPLK